MKENKERKVYMKIGGTKLLNIRVLLDGENVYEGLSDDAPDEIKELRYSGVEMGTPLTYIVYKDCNKELFE